MLSPNLFIKSSKNKGRGVFTNHDIEAETIIEVSPVIVMSKEDQKLLDKTLLHDYIFLWGKNNFQCCVALGYASMYNHSYTANCEYGMDFKRKIIIIKTVKNVKANEQLFINYNGDWDNKNIVWFDVKK